MPIYSIIKGLHACTDFLILTVLEPPGGIKGITGAALCLRLVLRCAEQTMRRMIEAAELKNQRTIAPEAHSMHLTPDTDPASTFRLRNIGARPRLDELMFGASSPPGSTQVTHC